MTSSGEQQFVYVYPLDGDTVVDRTCFRFTLYYIVAVVFNGWVWYRIVGACVFGHPLNSDGLQRLLDTVAAPSRGSVGTWSLQFVQ